MCSRRSLRGSRRGEAKGLLLGEGSLRLRLRSSAQRSVESERSWASVQVTCRLIAS